MSARDVGHVAARFTMKPPLALSLAFAFSAAWLSAQEPSAPVPAPVPVPAPLSLANTLLLGQDVVGLTDGSKRLTIGVSGYGRINEPRSRSLATLDDRVVDLAAAQMFQLANGRLVASALPATPIWSRELAAIDVDAAASVAQCLLVGDRVVLPRRGGGLVGLDRRTGDVAWRNPDCPNRLLQVADDLILATGTLRGGEWLHGLSWHNGARALAQQLPAPAVCVAATQRAIAVAGADWLRVFDRAGPLVFRADEGAEVLIGDDRGWLVRRSDEYVACDRTGTVLWRRPEKQEFMQQVQLALTDDGDVIATSFCRMADTGAVVERLVRATGEPRWRAQVQPLGIAHSKYRHRADTWVDGDRLIVASQASGGAFFATLDAGTGMLTERHEFR